VELGVTFFVENKVVVVKHDVKLIDCVIFYDNSLTVLELGTRGAFKSQHENFVNFLRCRFILACYVKTFAGMPITKVYFVETLFVKFIVIKITELFSILRDVKSAYYLKISILWVFLVAKLEKRVFLEPF
jgi:hypothetical protein